MTGEWAIIGVLGVAWLLMLVRVIAWQDKRARGVTREEIQKAIGEILAEMDEEAK